jgi:hypothetical protein
MFFTDDFIDHLRNEPVSGTIALCDQVFETLKRGSQDGWTDSEFDILIEAYALVAEVIESKLLTVQVNFLDLHNGGVEECQNLYQFLRDVREQCIAEESKLRLASLRGRFKASLGSGFIYEFSQGDLEKIQNLLNELRAQISSATNFELEHQQRLIRRLERLQSELHKRVGDLDRMWGLIGDAGVVVGKLGQDAKPIVDRIREIADIVWRTQSRAEELPSGTKLPSLEHTPKSSGEEV